MLFGFFVEYFLNILITRTWRLNMIALLVWIGMYLVFLSLSSRLVILSRHGTARNLWILILMLTLLLFASLFEVLLVWRVEHLVAIQICFLNFLIFGAIFCLRNTILLVGIIALNTCIGLLDLWLLLTSVFNLASRIGGMGRAMSHGLTFIRVVYNSDIYVIWIKIYFLLRTWRLFLIYLDLWILVRIIWILLWSLIDESSILKNLLLIAAHLVNLSLEVIDLLLLHLLFLVLSQLVRQILQQELIVGNLLLLRS